MSDEGERFVAKLKSRNVRVWEGKPGQNTNSKQTPIRATKIWLLFWVKLGKPTESEGGLGSFCLLGFEF